MYAKIEQGRVTELHEAQVEGLEHAGTAVEVGWHFDGNAFTPPLAEIDPAIAASALEEALHSPAAQLARIEKKLVPALIKAVLTGDKAELQSLEDHAELLRPHVTGE